MNKLFYQTLLSFVCCALGQQTTQNSRENSRTDSNSNNGSFYAPEEIGEGLVRDVSDRVEKDVSESPALQALERGYRRVVQGDWRVHIDPEVASDLRKYRSYQGESVRDLLRALRNKKHHYRELTEEAQQSLGEIPTKFTDYWLSRFPHLLTHTWCAMQPFRHEPMFRNYYHELYAFGTDDQYEEDPAETESYIFTYL
ncbi:unnamed protein product [Trichogramma brassicae]|uniref:KEN domain-containing protein n=1 Tax=Trichogramma brassicae TaxID=86971 RepID=A0A6H5I8R3_9HYME|nr:unnamed protein product [Trichogramma brassicae]